MFSISFGVEKTIAIDRGTEDVFEVVSDFTTWPKWSPWLCQEPSCPVTIEGTKGLEGHSQAWDGDFIGSGKMHITKVSPGKGLEYELTFLKPWKSKSGVGFSFTPTGEGTEVRWWMRGGMPFFMFPMKAMMSALIGGDYSRGLSMLKEYLETGTVPSETVIKGLINRGALYYLGKRRSCGISDIGPTMEEDFAKLEELTEASGIANTNGAFSIYHRYDIAKGQCEYTSGFLYDSPQEKPEGCVSGELPAHRALRVVHRGPYRHLGNAWSAAMGCARLLYKANKKLRMYEVYLNNPKEVPEEDVRVEIYIPLRD